MGESKQDVLDSVSTAMVLVGINALSEWEEKKAAGQDVSDGDLVTAIYEAMKRERLCRR